MFTAALFISGSNQKQTNVPPQQMGTSILGRHERTKLQPLETTWMDFGSQAQRSKCCVSPVNIVQERRPHQ